MFVMQPDSETVRFAGAVAQQANICGVRLLAINASSDHDPSSEATPSNPVASFEIQDVDFSVPGLLSVTCMMQVSVTWSHEESPQPEGISTWSLTYLAEYRIPQDEIPEEIRTRGIPAFAAINVPYNLWPYFRQAIQSSASEMGIVGLVLPPLRYEPQAAEPKPTTSAEKQDNQEAVNSNEL